jgi:hypothetical protein
LIFRNGLPSDSAMVDAGTSVIVKVVSHPVVSSTLIVSYEKNFRYEGEVVIASLLLPRYPRLSHLLTHRRSLILLTCSPLQRI